MENVMENVIQAIKSSCLSIDYGCATAFCDHEKNCIFEPFVVLYGVAPSPKNGVFNLNIFTKFQEINFDPEVICEPIDKKLTFRSCQLEDGDIICFQKSLSAQSSQLFRLPDVQSFLKFRHKFQVEKNFLTAH